MQSKSIMVIQSSNGKSLLKKNGAGNKNETNNGRTIGSVTNRSALKANDRTSNVEQQPANSEITEEERRLLAKEGNLFHSFFLFLGQHFRCFFLGYTFFLSNFFVTIANLVIIIGFSFRLNLRFPFPPPRSFRLFCLHIQIYQHLPKQKIT